MSLIAERDGIEGLRQIDESVNRRPASGDSHTFHGRDVFGYTGARLAASMLNLAVALNQRSYAALHKIKSGPGWSIETSRNQ